MHGITAALFATICGYFLVKAVKRWSNYWFFWCGLMLGLGMWFYAAFRLFPLVVMVFFAMAVVISKPHWKLVISSLLAISYGALIGSAPLIQYAVTNQEEFFRRTKESSIFTFHSFPDLITSLIDSFVKHLLMFNFRGDPNPRHNIPYDPMLDPLTGALFIVGVTMILFYR